MQRMHGVCCYHAYSFLSTLAWANEFECKTQYRQANEVDSDAEKNSDEQEECPDEKEKDPPRRALPAPFPSPPFPSAEYQDYPLIDVPPNATVYPLMEAIYSTPFGDAIKKTGIKALWLRQT